MTHAGLDFLWGEGYKGSHLGGLSGPPSNSWDSLRGKDQHSVLPLSPPTSLLGSTWATVDPGGDVGTSTHQVLYI